MYVTYQQLKDVIDQQQHYGSDAHKANMQIVRTLLKIHVLSSKIELSNFWGAI